MGAALQSSDGKIIKQFEGAHFRNFVPVLTEAQEEELWKRL